MLSSNLCANAARWRKPAPNGIGTLGDAVLQSRSQFTQTYYIWLGALVLLAWTVLCNFLLMLAMTYLGREPPLSLSWQKFQARQTNSEAHS